MAMAKYDARSVPGSFFYNQPPYTQFNKTFDDPFDALYQQLNEVHPVFMKAEHLQQGFEYQLLLDPRTGKEVERISYDYSSDGHQRNQIFRSVLPSNLTITDHTLCLRLLKAWQEFSEVDEADVVYWNSLELARTTDKIAFEKLVMEYCRTQKEVIYAPTKRLAALYKRLYAVKLEQLLKIYPENLALNTQAGIPHAQSYMGGRGRSVQIENVRLVTSEGWVPVLKEYAYDLMRLNLRLENLMDYYINSLEFKNDPKWEASEELEPLSNQFYIPLESLLFLLTAGKSPDLPTEVPLEIADNSEGSFKIITFEEPLPPRICGWYTHKMIVENAFEALVSTSEDTQWLHIENNAVKQHKRSGAPEIEAVRNSRKEFRAYEFNEYMQKVYTKREESIKTNFGVVQWNLNSTDEGQKNIDLQLFTRLKLAPATDISGSQLLSSHSLKLEYKPQFGAEIMTNYELLKEWLHIKLLSQCKGFTDHSLCLRVAVNDFSVQLNHKLKLAAIEEQLMKLYHIRMPQLLAGLADILQLLLNIPTGKYFLRFNPKYPDQLLLSAPSAEITPNTVFLHSLIKVDPSDFAFITNVQPLPISDLLCTAVHEHHQIAPCAFKPTRQKNHRIPPKTYGILKSDEEYVQKRIKAKLELNKKKKKEFLRQDKIRRNQIKSKKAKRRTKLKKVEVVKSSELEKFINEF
ncbi:little elongation complex subunit 2 [Anastrepha obliqua]|uniref:little elongation complex subunit 2 n=1 Tax=Anastrepha obliqua TaxID=95512 RepID=UPI00240A6E15|nr:little elongation complex subunit 2 [Anastrepha obliqua]